MLVGMDNHMYPILLALASRSMRQEAVENHDVSEASLAFITYSNQVKPQKLLS